MKYFILLLSLILSGASAHASFSILCKSSNQWVTETLDQPLGAGEIWIIEMEGLGDPKPVAIGSPNITETYKIKMTKRRNNQVIDGPYVIQSILTQFEESHESSLSFSLPSGTSSIEDGRFTIRRLPKPYSIHPFVMYGWSKVPVTVSAAMYYQCQIEDVY